MSKFWVVTGKTESSDAFEFLFNFKPTADEIDAYICHRMPIEYSEVGFTNWKLHEKKVINKDDITKEMIAEMKEVVAGVDDV